MLSKCVRYTLRKILRIRKYETISANIRRRKTQFAKKIYKKPISRSQIYSVLKELGIKEGDNLLVHASWRDLYNFQGEPDELIEVLRQILGGEGTLLMPSYGPTRSYLDVECTPSSAGVLSEIFRLQPNTVRSACTHFSISASGKNAVELTKEHINSEYGFDHNSPYYLLSKFDNSKVLFIGLGKEPTQISLFHCAGYLLKEKNPALANLLSYKYRSTLIKDKIQYEKEMVIRKPGHKNNNKVFKKILNSINNRKHVRNSNVDFVLIDAKEGLNNAIEYANKGIYCYKGIK
ncbi:AAC(3) family N-acetyltransferase [Salipaludibacillus daqingensis]|uniref:AAC(3) family N-acetyltransferase n=1 Tax=Salipaludibacillus daqingensis TaxID=3041001 RepID=UPI00247430EF|nr:AAC(3) family N-acetyltransferase [Salipaludibacillus daqingensis]